MSRMLVAVLTIGFIGFLLDRVMLTLQSLTDFSGRR
jgi:ABC-type nitrate/sulfonate/bicarbonate transport system permease component